MIILHICDWYHPIGGAERLLFDTLSALEVMGHTNIIIYNDHPSAPQTLGLRPEYPCKGLEHWVYFHPGSATRAKLAIDTVQKVIDFHKPDVCHIHNFQNPYVSEFLIKKLPCVRSIHDPRLYCFTNWKLLPDHSICLYPIGNACIREGCLSKGIIPRNDFDRNAPYVFQHYTVHKQMPVLIAESSAQIKVLTQSGFSPEQIAWLPNFTHIEKKTEVKEFLGKYYQKTETPILLFVGRASYEKGAQVLLEACKYIQAKCKIVLITAGPMLKDLQEQAIEFGDKVEIIAGLPYDETKKWYARASCIIVPSIWLENFCLVGLEAFANMKPVIGSNIGGIPDWLRDEETGWLVQPGDVHALAARIDLALEDPDRLLELGRNAYERVSAYYNQELYLSRLSAIYSKGIDRYNNSI